MRMACFVSVLHDADFLLKQKIYAHIYAKMLARVLLILMALLHANVLLGGVVNSAINVSCRSCLFHC